MPLKHTITQKTLRSGAKGMLVHVPDTTVMSYMIHFRAGNDYVKRPEIHQTAHLMEHMAFGPNEKFPTMEAFSQEFSRNGAYSNASTFDVGMHYYADCAQFEWDRILELQQLAITKPKFLSEMLTAEKGNVREELTGQMHNNPRAMWQAINRAMGSNSFTDAEKIATIDAVSVEDIIEHHQRTHTHENMRFVLAGDFSEGRDVQAIAMLESWDLPRGSRLDPVIVAPRAADPVVLRRNDQENINFGIALMLRRNLDVSELVSMGALNYLLTGTFHSRIFGKARSGGICYGVGSGQSTSVDGTSSWEFYGQVRPDNASALFALIQRELKRVADGDVSEDDLRDAQQYLTGDFQMRGQTVGALAHWYAGDYFVDDTVDDINDAATHIANVTVDEMVRLAREFLAAGIWTLGEIGAADATSAQDHYDTLAPLFVK